MASLASSRLVSTILITIIFLIFPENKFASAWDRATYGYPPPPLAAVSVSSQPPVQPMISAPPPTPYLMPSPPTPGQSPPTWFHPPPMPCLTPSPPTAGQSPPKGFLPPFGLTPPNSFTPPGASFGGMPQTPMLYSSAPSLQLSTIRLSSFIVLGFFGFFLLA